MLHFSASATGLIKRGNFAEARRLNDYLLTPTNHSCHVKESKTVLDYGFHPSEFQILNSGYFAACKESRVRQPGASGFCDRASEFCAQLARRAGEDFLEN